MTLHPWRAWRERGWQVIDATTYRQVWQRFGGSVATHPDVIERLAGLAQIPVRYLGWEQNGGLVAAVPCWGRHLALSKEVLKKRGKRGLFDLGNAEIILPLAEEARVPVRQRLRYVSELNAERIAILRKQPEGLALARQPEDYSKKFRYNLRREQRLFEEAGGEVRPLAEFTPRRAGRHLYRPVRAPLGLRGARQVPPDRGIQPVAGFPAWLVADAGRFSRGRSGAVQGRVVRLDQLRVHQWWCRPPHPSFQPRQRSQLHQYPGRLGGCAEPGQTPALFLRPSRLRIQGPLVPSCAGIPVMIRLLCPIASKSC